MDGFDPKLFDNLEREIILKTEAEAEKIAYRIALILERNVKEVLAENKKVATGEAIKSVKSEVTKKVNEYLIRTFLGVNYGVFIHEDTKPHYPPLHKIRDWVRIKGIAEKVLTRGKNKGKTRAIRSYKSMDDYWKVDQVARAIAWKIYRKGTKGIKFFEIALKQAWPIIEKEVQSFRTA